MNYIIICKLAEFIVYSLWSRIGLSPPLAPELMGRAPSTICLSLVCGERKVNISENIVYNYIILCRVNRLCDFENFQSPHGGQDPKAAAAGCSEFRPRGDGPSKRRVFQSPYPHSGTGTQSSFKTVNRIILV